MFRKNDHSFFSFRNTLSLAIVAVWAGIVLFFSVLGAVLVSVVYLLYLIPGAFSCWVLWILNNLIISLMCDIKLIRNKLYGLGCEDLKASSRYEDASPLPPDDTSEASMNETAYKKKTDLLLDLKSLLDSGVITQEEFDQEKKKLL